MLCFGRFLYLEARWRLFGGVPEDMVGVICQILASPVDIQAFPPDHHATVWQDCVILSDAKNPAWGAVPLRDGVGVDAAPSPRILMVMSGP